MADRGVANRRAVALVTGASRGIGAEVARSLAVAGFDLLLTARSAHDLEAVAKDVRAGGGRASCLAADAEEPASSAAAVEAAQRTFGRLDALVCCAGVLDVVKLRDASDERLLRSLSLNLLAPMRFARDTARAMAQQRGGRIVFVASTFAFVSAAGYSLYTASKAGLVGLTRALALELVDDGIRVNAIAPGQVRTRCCSRCCSASAKSGSPVTFRRSASPNPRRSRRP